MGGYVLDDAGVMLSGYDGKREAYDTARILPRSFLSVFFEFGDGFYRMKKTTKCNQHDKRWFKLNKIKQFKHYDHIISIPKKLVQKCEDLRLGGCPLRGRGVNKSGIFLDHKSFGVSSFYVIFFMGLDV